MPGFPSWLLGGVLGGVLVFLLLVITERPHPAGVADHELRRLCDEIHTEARIAHKQFLLLSLAEQRERRGEHVAMLSRTLTALQHCPR